MVLEKLVVTQLVKKFPFPPLDSVMRHMNPVLSLTSCSSEMQFYCPHIYGYVFQITCSFQVYPLKFVRIPRLYCACYMPRSSHASRFVHPNNIW